jgi:DNA-binding CsgD family transcriptional regulator
MSAAEDAAIIRQALALLSPAERAALVMWEMEGRSTEEIAAELGIKESAVRHTVSRARASLRKVLSTLVVHEETGLTALDALSTTYKKAAELAQKSSKAALSLLLVITAFLGFNSMTGNEGVPALTAADVAGVSGTTPSSSSASAAPSATATAAAKAQAAATAAAKKAQKAAINAKIAALSFFGLSTDGTPTTFTVTDAGNIFGKARVTKGISILGTNGLVINNQFITGSVGPNILIDQLITVDGTGTNYSSNNINIGFGGTWRAVEINSTESMIERMPNGQHLVTATFTIGYLKTSEISVPTGKRGYDLADAPKSITTRILLDSGKSQILAQAVQVLEK